MYSNGIEGAVYCILKFTNILGLITYCLLQCLARTKDNGTITQILLLIHS